MRVLTGSPGKDPVYLLLVRDVSDLRGRVQTVMCCGELIDASALRLPGVAREGAGGSAASAPKEQLDLIESLRRYERMVSSSRDALALLDRDHRYLAVNQAYLELWRKESREVIGHHISQVVGKRFYNRISAPAFERCLAGETVNLDSQYVDYPSGGRYVEATHNPYRDDRGAICGVLIPLRDVSQRHLAELAL